MASRLPRIGQVGVSPPLHIHPVLVFCDRIMSSSSSHTGTSVSTAYAVHLPLCVLTNNNIADDVQVDVVLDEPTSNSDHNVWTVQVVDVHNNKNTRLWTSPSISSKVPPAVSAKFKKKKGILEVTYTVSHENEKNESASRAYFYSIFINELNN